MRIVRLCIGFVLIGIIATALGYRFSISRRTSSAANDTSGSIVLAETGTRRDLDRPTSVSTAESYRLEASQSRFIAHAHRGGLLWFKGHDHLIGVREFTGEARIDPSLIANSSLQITAKTASMAETSSDFTDAQKKIINKELHDIVFLPDQHPDITFKSAGVSGEAKGNNQYELKIIGDLALNGVTRQIKIPTKVIVSGNDLRAQGEFSIARSDYKVKATSAMHGLIRVRDRVDFTFDIVGRR